VNKSEILVEESPSKLKRKSSIFKRVEPIGQKPITYEFMGEELDAEELILLIKVSEAKSRHFKVGRFFLIMFYHFLFFCMTPFVAIPVIYVLEGYNSHLLANMRFNVNHLFFWAQCATSFPIVGSYFMIHAWHVACTDET
jgi:hypothetical protein